MEHESDQGTRAYTGPHTPEERRELASEIAHESPEGLPADPQVGPAKIGKMLLTVMGGLFLAAVIVSFVNIWAGLALAGIAILSLSLNPVVGVSFLRANERKKVEHTHDAPPRVVHDGPSQ